MGCSHHFPGHFFSSELTASGALWLPLCQQSLGRQTTLGSHFKSPGKGAKPGLFENPNSQSSCQILCIISVDLWNLAFIYLESHFLEARLEDPYRLVLSFIPF